MARWTVHCTCVRRFGEPTDGARAPLPSLPPHQHTPHPPPLTNPSIRPFPLYEQEGVLRVCLDMFFKYQWTSVLHQSITRIVTWIMDAGPSRLGTSVYM